MFFWEQKSKDGKGKWDMRGWNGTFQGLRKGLLIFSIFMDKLRNMDPILSTKGEDEQFPSREKT